MKSVLALAGLALAAGCAASPEAERLARADTETALAAELRDYDRDGPAVSCVPLRNLGGNRSAGERAIIFEGPGNRLWVNRPPAGCPLLRDGRALRFRTTSTSLCSGEIVSVFDAVAGTEYGSCGLGDFEPWNRRPRD